MRIKRSATEASVKESFLICRIKPARLELRFPGEQRLEAACGDNRRFACPATTKPPEKRRISPEKNNSLFRLSQVLVDDPIQPVWMGKMMES